MPKSTTLLCILDGLGLNPNPKGNAFAQAKKPNLEKLLATCPNNTLITYGERVGLPEGQMGNSEVGHLNIGAGRVVEQWLLRISRALNGNFLANSDAFLNFTKNSQASKNLHLIGLFSDGGVHSHSEHLLPLLNKLPKVAGQNIYLHLITDGRDTSPTRSLEQVKQLQTKLSAFENVKIKSICGRFFAMDRDKRWERTEKAYRALILGDAQRISDPLKYISDSYQNGVTDEFLEPALLDPSPAELNDSVIFWNFREDRARQISKAICVENFDGFKRSLQIDPQRSLSFTEYDHNDKLPYLFEPIAIQNHLGEFISGLGLSQLRVAETEKYPHVTYFFNGGVEKAWAGEDRKIIPSPRDVKTYDQRPEMSAEGVCQVVLDGINSRSYDLIVVNFANCDMVGHTGVLSAGIRAVETVDSCLGRILKALDAASGRALIIADHGNCEYMINLEDDTPNTAHTKFPVPVIVYGAGNEIKIRSNGALCDVAPTVLKMMGLNAPKEMSGTSLF